MSQSNRITVQFRGMPEDGGDVRFGAFLKKLEAMKDSLAETDKVVSEGDRSADYKVVDLRHSSPSMVVIEATPVDEEHMESAGFVMDTFYETLVGLQNRGDIPAGFDYNALQKFKGLEPTGKGITEITFSRNGDELQISSELSENIDYVLGPDEYEEGSVTGMLQHLNVHGKQKVFTIYPTAGEPKLSCSFQEHLRRKVVEGVDRYVEVFGTLKYKARNVYPYFMLAQDIDIYPDEASLPSAGELFGIAPEATGNKSSEEFIRELRLGW